MNKLEFTNKVLDNLNDSISEDGKVGLAKFIELTDDLYDGLTLTDVGCSLKILCKDLNLDPESVLLEYCNIENGFEVYYDEGIVETYLVKKGFIQL